MKERERNGKKEKKEARPRVAAGEGETDGAVMEKKKEEKKVKKRQGRDKKKQGKARNQRHTKDATE